MNSRQKGSRGERELAKIFREHGYEARRGQQYCGISGDADVVGLPGIHVECKRVEKLNLLDAMEQAVRMQRMENCLQSFIGAIGAEWLVTMRLEDWFSLFREWEAGTE